MSFTSNNLLLKNLIDYGLTEKEGRVYLTLLKLQDATASDISKASNIKRSSI